VLAEDGARVFSLGSDEYRAAQQFRDDLRAAKVTRAELFEKSKARRPIRVHDLRATFATVSLAGGVALGLAGHVEPPQGGGQKGGQQPIESARENEAQGIGSY
jgi:hypothetical protein